jgi:hypothetical protein
MYKNAWKGNAESYAFKTSLSTMQHPLDNGKETGTDRQTDSSSKKQSKIDRLRGQMQNPQFMVNAFVKIKSNAKINLIHALWRCLDTREAREVSRRIVEDANWKN